MKKLTDAEKVFLTELADLMKRHGVSIYGSDEYDGADNFCGREYTLTKYSESGGGIHLTMSDLERSLP